MIDRVLKPKMSLANAAQNKHFLAAGVSVNQRAQTKSFYSPEKSATKSFYAANTFSPQQFATRHFRTGNSSANVATKTRLTESDTMDITSAPVITRAAAQSGSSVATSAFAPARPFLDQGKSQKSLSAHNAPLTIEQVRDLLNKNK